jgi:hypothetical protein
MEIEGTPQPPHIWPVDVEKMIQMQLEDRCQQKEGGNEL